MPKFDDPKCPFAVSRPPEKIPVARLDRFAYLSPVASKRLHAHKITNKGVET
jgi:hypothetical protein